ncbi:MAG: protein kinase [Planctomycetes bacterium]|nr:protein kinase [Planctomycetota bacterium]
MIDRTCQGCGVTVPAGARYCPACATPVGDGAGAKDGAAPGRGGEALLGGDDLSPPLPNDTVLGEYRIVEKIGEGGFGHVYRAVHVLLPKQQFALKTLKPELAADRRLRKRFLLEAQVLLDLEHRNLVPIRHVSEAGGHLYLVMTLCPGRSLKAILNETPRLPMATAAAVATQVLAGLEHAHAKGIVHRDLKPSNILIDTNAPGGWHVRVIDFGIAKLLLAPDQADDKDGELSLTGGAVVGTRAYMSPEQCLGGQIDERTDLWSLGVVLYEMVVGERPTPLVAPPAPFAAAGLGDGLPGFEALIFTALEREPAARHASARAMKHELDLILRAAEEETSRPGPVPSPPAPDSSRLPPVATDTTNTETSTPSEAAPPPPPGVGGLAVAESSRAGTATSGAYARSRGSLRARRLRGRPPARGGGRPRGRTPALRASLRRGRAGRTRIRDETRIRCAWSGRRQVRRRVGAPREGGAVRGRDEPGGGCPRGERLRHCGRALWRGCEAADGGYEGPGWHLSREGGSDGGGGQEAEGGRGEAGGRRMKTFANLFEPFSSIPNLLLAYRKARRGKRGRPAVLRFDYDLEFELSRLRASQLGGTWSPGPYRSFYVFEAKKRLISAAPFPDRVG